MSYDIFISYSTTDQLVAEFLHLHLTSEGMRVFLARTSLQPGQRWSQEILCALKESSMVLFLASRAACESPWVQQELGAALITQKKIVPVIWDISPAELPGWVHEFQTLNLAGASIEDAKAQMTTIANIIKSDRNQGLLMAGLVIAGLIVVGSMQNTPSPEAG